MTARKVERSRVAIASGQLVASVCSLGLATLARAAELPAHRALRVLVVSDEVNPHRLSAAELTQPGDISAALNQADSGLQLQEPTKEVSSQCVDDALAALRAKPPVDVLIYFAHQAVRDCAGQDRQADLTQLGEECIRGGGGVVVFHHGSYEWSGKDALLALLGVSASGIQWDTQTGQRVFNVAPGHFVTTQGMKYSGRGELEGLSGVPSAEYDYFDNLPDERYPTTRLFTTPNERRTLLFATDSGNQRVLGYSLEKPDWQGRVVFFQPGEYQPNALDRRSGPAFQILANSILYAAHAEPSGNANSGGQGGSANTGTQGMVGGQSGGKQSGGGGRGSAEGLSGASSTPSGGSGGAGAGAGTLNPQGGQGGQAPESTGAPAAGSAAASGSAPSGSGGSLSSGGYGGGSSVVTPSAGNSSSTGMTPSPADSQGCACRTSPPWPHGFRHGRGHGWWSGALAALVVILRRRRRTT